MRHTQKNQDNASRIKLEASCHQLVPRAQQSPCFLILLAVQLFLDAWCSFRGAARALALFAQLTGIQSPSYGTVRRWVYRLGHYCLMNAPLFDDKWVMILDHTVELGREKCLVILGAPLCALKSGRYTLGHHDVRLLDMDIASSSTGEQVQARIEKVVARYGAPAQIVSDHGSDLKKGISLFCDQQTASIVHTYDITHLLATLVKNELKNDVRWEAFTKAATHTGQKLNQTDLYFLAPPKQRTKARFMNQGRLINWAQQVIAYLNRLDFQEVGGEFGLDRKEGVELMIWNSTCLLSHLPAMEEKYFPTRDAFLMATRECIGQNSLTMFQERILEKADKGKSKVEQALKWLLDYQEDVAVYAEMQQVAQAALTHVKREGLGLRTYHDLQEIVAGLGLKSQRGLAFKDKVLQAIHTETIKIPLGEIYQGSSDVIESLFGKYKQISTRAPLKTMGHLTLTLPLMTTALTVEVVKRAMEETGCRDLTQWASSSFGESALAKRRRAFKAGPKVG